MATSPIADNLMINTFAILLCQKSYALHKDTMLKRLVQVFAEQNALNHGGVMRIFEGMYFSRHIFRSIGRSNQTTQ